MTERKQAKPGGVNDYVVKCPNCGQTIQVAGETCSICDEPFDVYVEFPGL